MSTPAPRDRYQRQVILPGLGPSGQSRLAQSHAVVVGVGVVPTTQWLESSGLELRDGALLEGFEKLAPLGIRTVVHAENSSIMARL